MWRVVGMTGDGKSGMSVVFDGGRSGAWDTPVAVHGRDIDLPVLLADQIAAIADRGFHHVMAGAEEVGARN